MRLRILWLTAAQILLLLAVYYAGYRYGLRRTSERTQTVAVPAGESDRPVARVREPARAVEPARRTASLHSISSDDFNALLARNLRLPVPVSTASQIIDTFDQTRSGGKRHEATDIMSPRGTPIYAVQDGTIRKLFFSKAGGNTIYEFDPEEIYCYYYAHLDRYADGLHEGMSVKKGDLIGYVGSTGDADRGAPHLHFAIIKLDPDKKWWQGTPINPYPVLARIEAR